MPFLSSSGSSRGFGFTAASDSGLYAFTSFTFTNANITGVNGPTRTNCLSAYNTTTYPWLNDTAFFNVVTQGYQLWTVPKSGSYRILALGAKGGNSRSSVGGSGASIRGDFSLTAGEKLRIVVGQMGATHTTLNGGGGGGTFVMRETDNTTSGILVIAGGGGAGGYNDFGNNRAGTTSTTSQPGWNGNSNTSLNNGRSSGLGGLCQDGSGGGGGGLTGNGGSSLRSTASTAGKGGFSFTNGAVGGYAFQSSQSMEGGFGGGGSGDWNYWTGGGGGGGYSGGSGGYYYGGGGGGASYNNGANQSNSSGSNSGHGTVTITLL